MATTTARNVPLHIHALRAMVRSLIADAGFSPSYSAQSPSYNLVVGDVDHAVFTDPDIDEVINDVWMAWDGARGRQTILLSSTSAMGITGAGTSNHAAGAWNYGHTSTFLSVFSHINNLFLETTGAAVSIGPPLRRVSLREIIRINHTDTPANGTPTTWAAERVRPDNATDFAHKWHLAWTPPVIADTHFFSVEGRLDPARLDADPALDATAPIDNSPSDAPTISFLEGLQVASRAAQILAGLAGWSDDAIQELGRLDDRRVANIDRSRATWL